MIDDKYILKKFINANNCISHQALLRITEEEQQYLLHRYTDSTSIKETINRIKYSIETRPVCVICGKPVEFCGKKNNLFYTTCSLECRKQYKSIVSSSVMKNKTSEEKQQSLIKGKQTKLERYGDINYNNRKLANETCLERYGVTNVNKLPETRYKIKQTCLSKYGVEFVGQLDTNIFKTNNPQKQQNIKEKTKRTNQQRYGGNSPTCDKTVFEKQRKTLMENYNVEYYAQTDEFKDLLKQLYNIIQKKTINTNLQKYGVKYSSQNSYVKQKQKHTWQNKTTDELNNILKKIYKTKKCNNSFNSSNDEEYIFAMLKEKYPDVVRQYRDDRYPFNCDFYIPNKDLFIEYQGSWTHGSKPFEGTLDDLLKLQNWCEKNTKYYDNAITTWCIRDVKKRNIAKQNKLNYIEVWNLTQFNLLFFDLYV